MVIRLVRQVSPVTRTGHCQRRSGTDRLRNERKNHGAQSHNDEGQHPGTFHGIDDGVKARQTLQFADVPGLEENAERYVACGYADCGDKLIGRAYERDEALFAKVAKEVAAQAHDPANDPKPGSEPIYYPMRMVR